MLDNFKVIAVTKLPAACPTSSNSSTIPDHREQDTVSSNCIRFDKAIQEVIHIKNGIYLESSYICVLCRGGGEQRELLGSE